MKKTLLSLFGILALLGCLAMAPDALASDGLFAGPYEGDVTAAHCGDASPSFILPKLKGVWVMVPPDPAAGMESGFAAVSFDDHIVTSGTAALMIGGAHLRFTKASAFI